MKLKHKFITSILIYFLVCCNKDPISKGIIAGIQQVNSDFNGVVRIEGNILYYNWESSYLNENRSITVYLPPKYNDESNHGVLFLTDNAAIPCAKCIEPLLVDGEIKPIIIVGINLRSPQPIDTVFGDYIFDFRNLEFFKSEQLFVSKKHESGKENAEMSYVPDFDNDPDLGEKMGISAIISNRYSRFTSYIIYEVIPFVKNNFSVSANPEDWTLGGFSSGGAFVYNFTCDFPGIFGNAIVTSPAGPFDEYNFSKSTSKYFLAAGNQELFMKESLRYIPEFENYGIWYTHLTYNTGHDWRMGLTFCLESVKYIYKK